MSIPESSRDHGINGIILGCEVGCLRHAVGITYMNFFDQDEPELYFETMHIPCEGFWMRLWSAIKFTAGKHRMGCDSTVLGVSQAEELIAVLNKYIKERGEWEARLVATAEKGQAIDGH